MRRGERTFLAFDYGTKKIGIAVGQELTSTAQALVTLRYVKNQPDWQGISKIVDEWRPDALVVGKPLDMSGEQQEMTHAADRFAASLQGRYHLPVYFADERLSSADAAGMLDNKKKRNKIIDHIAAQLILQTFFSEQQHQEKLD